MDEKITEKKEDLGSCIRKTDIGNSRCAETLRSALENEETLRRILNNSQVVLFLWKNEDRWPVEFVSENVTNLGYTVEDLTSGRILYWDIIYPDDLGHIQKEFEERVKRGSPGFIIEYRILTKTGDIRWVNQKPISWSFLRRVSISCFRRSTT